MKLKLMLFTFLIESFQIVVLGQTNSYHPFPDSAALWKVGCGVNADPCYGSWTFNYILTGEDTTIGIHQYKKIYYQPESCYGPNPCFCTPGLYGGGSMSYDAAIRDDSVAKKVFIAINGIDSLLYNFNLTIGDTIQGANTWLSPLEQCISIVNSIDSVLCGNQYRKRWNTNIFNLVIIEGIGSTFGLLEPMCAPFESGCGLNCYSQNNVTLFGSGVCAPASINENNITSPVKIYPNPANSRINISFSIPETVLLTLYNSIGQPINQLTIEKGQLKTEIDISQFPIGLYFISVRGKGWTRTEKIIKSE